MKSLVFQGIRDIRYEDVPDPQVSDAHSAIVRITRCGLCGSDLHSYNAGAPSTGFCIGHKALGEMVEAGHEVSRFKPGDRVLITGSISCGNCEMCRQGRAMVCRNNPICRVLGQGQPGLGGCRAEAIEIPTADFNLCHLPGGYSDALGIMLSDNLATGWAGKPCCLVTILQGGLIAEAREYLDRGPGVQFEMRPGR